MLSEKSPYAIYMPAISAEYARIGHARGLKRSLPFPETDLNFLDPAGGLFHYPYALYSAGQAARTDGSAAQASIVSTRDRTRTTIIGDSGGFQIQEGTIRFDRDATCERMLRWLEGHADFSMTLDFPTGGIGSGNMLPHAKRLETEGYDLGKLSRANGLSKDFNACLQQSLINLDYFTLHRLTGATNFLNVIQGRNEQESKVWYDAVKGYGLEGWAFAGVHQSSFSMLLNRLIDMKMDGFLQRAKWIHVLGVSTLASAYLFTTILRCIRRFNPDIQLSFDTASPFRSAANFQFCTGYRIDKYGVKIEAKSMPDVGSQTDNRTLNELCASLVNSRPADHHYFAAPIDPPEPAQTAIGERVKVSDICVGSQGSSSLDSDSVLLLMNHNVQVYVNAFAALHEGFDTNPLQEQIPPKLRIARELIETILLGSANTQQTIDPRGMIKECAYHLDVFAQE